MESEILAIKLCELDKQMGSIHGRILELEHAPDEVLQQEIDALGREYREKEEMLRNNLRFSRASSVSVLYKAYTEVEAVLNHLRAELQNEKTTRQSRAVSSPPEPDENTEREVESETASAEEKLLFAEYALDFAMQAANRALLISLEAAQEERRCSKTVLKP